jgi:nucleotide-binding universal stress UspA family protein
MPTSERLRFQSLLCATDFSEASMAALDTAAELCCWFGGELELVNVVAPMPLMPTPFQITPGIVSPGAEIKT